MSDHAPQGRPAENKDRAVASISFQFYVNGQQAWSRGEYESFVNDGEDESDAMLRASDNALQIAFDTRDAFVRRNNKNKEH